MLGILARPEKALAGGALQAQRVDLAAAEDGFVFLAEVIAYDADQVHVREEAGGYGEIGSGAADDAVNLAIGAFNGVKCYGSDNQKSQGHLLQKLELRTRA